MRKKYRKQVTQYARQSRYRSVWHKLVQFMACIVVFCTTYALILPAITMEQTYSCGLEEHVHEADCYETVTEQSLSCSPSPEDTEHVHTDECYITTETLVCTLEVHAHTDSCRSDPNADLETEAQWRATLEHVQLTGNWSQDLAAIATSQIGYRESEKNYQVSADGALQGYSRYGAWYGIPYGKWDAMFAAFCMHYAAIPEGTLPFDPNTADWYAQLEGAGVMRLPGEASAQTGDLAFFADGSGAVTRVAVVTGIEGPDRVRLVEGDSGSRVLEHVVPLTGAGAPVGFVRLPDIQSPAELSETEPSETTVPTEATEPTEPLETTEPTEVTEPSEPVETTAPTEVTEPTEPVETTAPTEATEPSEPLEATEPGMPENDSQASPLSQGNASPMAESRAANYPLVTANPADLRDGGYYILYAQGNSGNQHILMGSDSNITPIQVTTGYWSSPYTIGGSWEITNAQVNNTEWKKFVWQVEKRNGQTYLVSGDTGQRLDIGYTGVSLSANGTALGFRTNGAATEINGGDLWLRYSNNDWRVGWYNGTSVYLAAITVAEPNYPHAVHTGEVNINRLRFFNICENGEEGISALAGCVFQITGENGYTATVTSGNDPEVALPADIPDGNYTITEVSAPDGYIRDTEHTRTFTIRNGALASDATIGTFINHDLEQLDTGKTGQVVDYVNRIYQVDITAESHMRMYEMDPMDLLFVVDQSNSMLFPSGLVSIGKSVRLRKDGTNNAANLDALNLDKSKMHYVIADPQGTSTVWAIWHDGTAWMCQDASYYAKAKHNNDPGYQDYNEIAIFPSDKSYAQQSTDEKEINSKYRSNGCGIGHDLGNSSLGKYIGDNSNGVEFVVYQSTDEYNRLHYLEEALANLIYEMADVNDKNRITLTRFSRTVDEEHCLGPLELNPDNTELLVDAVTSIKTSGGTRQDLALEHTYVEHLNDPNDNYKDFDHNYTLLITDGAPVRSGDDAPSNVGGPNDPTDKNGNTIYSRVKGHAADVRTKTHLMTVALGMESVEAGKQVLEEIATDDSFYCALDDAADLLEFIQKLLFESFKPKEEIEMRGDVEDEISDSFYPIAWTDRGSGEGSGRKLLHSDAQRDWVLLNVGDWITREGKLTAAGASDAAGQLLQREDGTFYVRWTDQRFTGGWKGTVYLKAKEDFIGGNAIDTNKNATVSMHGATVGMETPNVNVRLLDLNEFSSEVTVYLGDQVNGDGTGPIDVLQEYYRNIRFTKLIADGGDVMNKLAAAEADGLENDVFYLRYAIGRDLTVDEWSALMNGQTLTFPYTYDDPGSHGPVGEFTFSLTKTGISDATLDYQAHQATATCQPNGHPLTKNCDIPAETYTLSVTYNAYRLNQNGRPEENARNGPNGPGTEVGTGTTVPTGAGTVDSINVHEVHVISGTIRIHKAIEDSLISETDQTFTFRLHRVEDGEDTAYDRVLTITVPAGATQGEASITFDNLPRGTYLVTEAESDDYAVKDLAVLTTTNCQSDPPIGGSASAVTFVMGRNTSGVDVIGFAAASDRFTGYVDPYNGVFGEAVFTNAQRVYQGEIPVEKVWDDGAEIHTTDKVYLILYLDGIPVLDEQGNARVLMLDASTGWKGSFTAVLTDKDDKVTNYDYSVREASGISGEARLNWHPALLENDHATVLYYEMAAEDGKLITVGGRSYVVRYTEDEITGAWTVENLHAVELPHTGGTGTSFHTFGGAALIAFALMYYCITGRKRRKEAS